MNRNKNYTGIDCFRLIAALLIIAIHTSPLSSINETGDFILTRVIARSAVPFFFMTSGFFLISRYSQSPEKLIKFVRNILHIYGIAILIYLPINIYNGYFHMNNLLPNIIKDLLFDGTMYHLWYLPAAATGAVIAWYLVKRLDYAKAFLIAVILYVIGLFGDSYYGLSERFLGLHNLYDLIFQVSDYTRNGIFFAPIFFVLGGWMAEYEKRENPLLLKKTAFRFILSFFLMLCEAMTLRHFHIQRHDSMYLFLLPCMFFLFTLILHLNFNLMNKLRNKKHDDYFQGYFRILRSVSSIIYIIHPMMILVVRLAAKLLHLQKLLIDNSMIHYFAVCFISIVFAMIFSLLHSHNFYLSKTRKIQQEDSFLLLRPYYSNACNTHSAPAKDRAYIEINLNNLEHNVKVLRKIMPPQCELMAVVKAEAYGHSAFPIATHLNQIGVKAFAVATIDEGIALRKYGIRGEILILGYTDVCRVSKLRKYDLTQTLICFEYANELNKQCAEWKARTKILSSDNIITHDKITIHDKTMGHGKVIAHKKIKTHIKIDTGMHRLGLPYNNLEEIKDIFSMENIEVTGVYTHLCCSDSLLADDAAFCEMQTDRFYHLIENLKNEGIAIPKLHIQSSYGLLNYPNLRCDYARIGIALYGVLSTPNNDTILKPDLRPVLSLKTRVILIRTIRKGESVGYNRTFTAKRDSKIAILPIGYADGFPRSLSNGKGNVLIRGQRVPVVGRICMDQLAVDVTDIESISVGDTATLIGENEGETLPAPIVANDFGSISNEFLCRLGARLPVVVEYT